MDKNTVIAMLQLWGLPQEYINDLIDYSHNYPMPLHEVVIKIITERGLWLPVPRNKVK